MNPTRRAFLRPVAAAALALGLPAPAWAYGRGSRAAFTWSQLRYPGTWDPNPRAAERFLAELTRRTSVEAVPQRRLIDPGSPDLFGLPFLYVAGRGGWPDLGRGAGAWLRRYLEHGGFVWFDDATGVADSGFARGVEGLLAEALPGRPLKPLPGDHAILQSFYLLRDIPGRKIVRPFLYGANLEDLTPAVLGVNDAGGAYDGDPLGGYTHPCTPGGERQREMTIRLGVNLVLYALTGNYKKDQVHIPFILKRRQR